MLIVQNLKDQKRKVSLLTCFPATSFSWEATTVNIFLCILLELLKKNRTSQVIFMISIYNKIWESLLYEEKWWIFAWIRDCPNQSSPCLSKNEFILKTTVKSVTYE